MLKLSDYVSSIISCHLVANRLYQCSIIFPGEALSFFNTSSVGFSRNLLQKRWPGKQSVSVDTLIAFYDFKKTRLK